MLSDEEALAKVQSHRWFHAYELLPGIVTPGAHKTLPREWLTSVWGLDEDLSGKTALDIGALDGPYSFEMERRGAQVTSVDIQSPNVTGYNIAKEVLGSRAEYIQGNVYDLAELLKGRTFDVITYFGVWYHLKHPVRALEQIHRVLKPDGLLLLEGELLHHYAEAPGYTPEQLKEQARELAESPLPVCLFYGEGVRGDKTSWVVPNVACIRQWLAAAALELESYNTWTTWPNQRFRGRARKARGRTVLIDNPVW